MTNINQDTELFEISTRGRHALTAMVDLARRGGDRPVPLSDIAANRKISLSYLEQLFSGLRRHGLVKSYRGPGGGYVLAKPACDISVTSIIHAADDLPVRAPQPHIRRLRSDDDATFKLWESLGGHIARLLDQVTLDDVASERVEVYQKVFKTQP
ncbi:MAG: Rrf2 family transcriptional regulator [Proteobacteria bacterium]|nr:Rrf2 family transcriptional regulator [Pseudomonadota bacterium]